MISWLCKILTLDVRLMSRKVCAARGPAGEHARRMQRVLWFGHKPKTLTSRVVDEIDLSKWQPQGNEGEGLSSIVSIARRQRKDYR